MATKQFVRVLLFFAVCSIFSQGVHLAKEIYSYTPCGTDFLCFNLQRINGRNANTNNLTIKFNLYGDCVEDKVLQPCYWDSEIYLYKCKNEKVVLCTLKDLVYCEVKVTIHVFLKESRKEEFNQTFIRLIASDVPESALKIKYVEANPISSDKIKVLWSRPDCKNMEYSYVLNYTASSGTWIKMETLFDLPEDNTSVPQYIKSLKPFTEYQTCVAPHVKFRRNIEQFTCVTTRTAEAAPSIAPVIVKNTPIPVTKQKWKCKIEWKPVPKERCNGIVNKTIVKIFKEDDRNKALQVMPIPIEESSYIVDELLSSEGYFLQLEICNTAGCTPSKQKYISINHKVNESIRGSKFVESIIIPYIVPSLFGVLGIGILVVVGLIISHKRKKIKVSTENQPVIVECPPDMSPVLSANHIYEQIEDGEGIYEEIDENYRRIEPIANIPDNFQRLFNVAEDGRSREEYLVLCERTNSTANSDSEADDLLADTESADCETPIRTYSFETDPLMPYQQWST